MKTICLPLLTVLLLAPLGTLRADDVAKPGFQRRGFYLHGSWVMNHPFAVRTWERQDFGQMFRLLRHLGFNTVMWWPTPEVETLAVKKIVAAGLLSREEAARRMKELTASKP